ncbi:MAG: hypothetical protein JOZ40_06260 [Methylobacteriaceae bacterium]|nr:hypothetical protein [Methylobacteriaceae bacterium]
MQKTLDIFTRYGLRRIINASGTETTKGASPVCPEVIEAAAALVGHSVDMAELQSVACHTIADAFGTQAGCVVHCTAAGIVIAVAACMTGANLARVERLPDTSGMKNEVLLQRGHDVSYGAGVTQNVAVTGAKVVAIGSANECGVYQLAEAITPQTAAALYVVSHHTVGSGLIDLAAFCRTCRAAGVPVIVDAAAEPDPRLFLEAGADLVIVSMHKSFAGLTGGIIAGPLALVRACLYQEKGIGRPMKVGKEGVIGAIAAIERWASLDRASLARALDERLAKARQRLELLDGLTASIEPDATSNAFARLHLHVDPAQAGLTAHQLAQALWSQTPAIAVRALQADLGILQIDLRRADAETVEHIVKSIEKLVGAARSSRRSSAPIKGGRGKASLPPPSPNLADLTADALERWPLSMRRADKHAG